MVRFRIKKQSNGLVLVVQEQVIPCQLSGLLIGLRFGMIKCGSFYSHETVGKTITKKVVDGVQCFRILLSSIAPQVERGHSPQLGLKGITASQSGMKTLFRDASRTISIDEEVKDFILKDICRVFIQI